MSDSPTTKIHTTSSATLTLSEPSIIEFAQQFDPQPYHLDKQAGLDSIFGDLCASGWQVAALGTRLVGDALAKQGYTCIALTRVEQLRWKRPVLVNEDLQAHVTIVDIMTSCSIPDCHTAVVEADLNNSSGNCVAVMRCHAAVEPGDN